MFVLDEADEMLSRGFKDQIYEVFRELPVDIQVTLLYVSVSQTRTLLLATLPHTVSPMQVVLLSATIPVDVLEVTTKFMRDPIRILVKKEELSLEGIRQFYIDVNKEVRGLVCSPNECIRNSWNVKSGDQWND